jgi:MIP family channel proteins
MQDSIRHFVAEFVGTFALVFIGGGAIIVSKIPDSNIGLVEVALAHGIILAVMVSALMRISGHFNPAVTLGFMITGRIEAMMAGLYIVAQLVGGIAAAFALRFTMPATAFDAARAGGQAVSIDITAAQAITLEAIATFFLVFVVFGTAVDKKAPRIGGLAIGLTIAADILAIGPLTGASMNPARSFGPAFASQVWEGQLIYWIGPLVGGALAALLYDRLFIRHPIELADHGAIEPVP